MTREQCNKAVVSIVDDLTQRQGLSQEWESLPDSTKATIRLTWGALIWEAAAEVVK